jgi:hypothetical protein
MRCASVALIPDADYLLLLEDDTTVPPNTWTRLKAALDDGYEWVCGYEVGRWDCPCPGIWRIDKRRISSAEPGTGVEQVDATGIYLVLTTPELYRSAPWDVWDNSYGHDVSITYGYTRDGHKLGVDWTLECVHMTEERDWTVADAGPLTRSAHTYGPVLYSWPKIAPLTEFQSCGPRLIKEKELHAPKRPTNTPLEGRERMFMIGKDIEYGGEYYARGSIVPRSVALSMFDAGLIKTRVP